VIDLNIFENTYENIYILKKWNWDYLEAETFQLACVDYVQKNPHLSILIICSHPHCFTLGRGLQKIKSTVPYELIDHNQDINLSYPLHHIKRGGGLTFHYPGQFVFYPILNLTINKLGVHDLMLSIMEFVKILIKEQYSLNGLEIKKDLLGLWFEGHSKLASIGLAVNRFNTYHGLALNYFHDELMFNALKATHPCGLPGDIYKSLELLLSAEISFLDRELFCNNFIDMFIKKLFTKIPY
jgi:lipoyl(octanoyl) transferase